MTFYLAYTYAILQLSIRPSSPESLQQLIEIARSFASVKDENIRQSRDKKVRRPIIGHTFHCSNSKCYADSTNYT